MITMWSLHMRFQISLVLADWMGKVNNLTASALLVYFTFQFYLFLKYYLLRCSFVDDNYVFSFQSLILRENEVSNSTVFWNIRLKRWIFYPVYFAYAVLNTAFQLSPNANITLQCKINSSVFFSLYFFPVDFFLQCNLCFTERKFKIHCKN